MRRMKVPSGFRSGLIVLLCASTTSTQAIRAQAAGTWYQCRSWGENGTHQTVYVTPFIHTDAAAGTIQQAFYTYMHATYPVDKLGHESDYCRAASADPGQQAFSLSSQEKQWAASHSEVIHITWTYTPAEVAATNAAVASAAAAGAVPTAAANENYVVCASERDGPVIYVSEVFAAAMPPPPAGATPGNGWAQRAATGAFQTPFFAFLQKKYGYKSGSNYPVQCGVTFAPTAAGLKAAQAYKQSVADQAGQNKKQIVETGWKNE